MRVDEVDPVMTSVEVAEYLQIPEETIAKWRYIRTGPDYMRVGRHVRYRRSSVDRWLDGRERTAS